MTSDHPGQGHRKRLREKFLKSSLAGLHDYEAIELLLTFAIPRRDVKPIAKELVKRFGGIKGILDAGVEGLSSVEGVGDGAAVLIALVAVARDLYLGDCAAEKKTIKSSVDVAEFIRAQRFEGESFLAVYLNSKNEVLGHEVLHFGPIKEMALQPKKTIEGAFRHNARSIIFVHVLAGSKVSPAKMERGLVEELANAASALDIMVHDHVTITEDRHTSARDAGWLKAATD